MKRLKAWLKSQNPKFYIKIILAVLIFSALFISSKLNSIQSENEEASASSSEKAEEQEETQSKYEIHIGASNIIALAGALAALAIVKRRDMK